MSEEQKTEHPVKSNSHWSYPVKSGTGMVWYGFFTCTEEDIEELKKATNNPNVGIDEASLPGRYHPEWSSAWDATLEPSQRQGGKGSSPFEAQYCGDGVWFTKDPIWYFDRDGSGPFMDIPPNEGAYWRKYDGDGFLNIANCEPGSQAAEILDRRAYHWDEELGLYQPGPDKIVPWWT